MFIALAPDSGLEFQKVKFNLLVSTPVLFVAGVKGRIKMKKFSFPIFFIRQKKLDVTVIRLEWDILGVAKNLRQDRKFDRFGSEVFGHIISTLCIDVALDTQLMLEF
jgi:hypothetical protein